MPRFIERKTGYDLSLAAPYRNRSVNMQLHVLDAKLKPLRETLSRYLGQVAPPGVWYLPLGDRVVLSCVDIKEARAGDETLGSMHYVEISFFILALRFDPLPRAIVSFNPYLFVNTAWTMVMGREVHGFRKDVSTSFSSTLNIDSPSWQHRARDLEHVKAWAMKKHDTNSRAECMKLMEIRHPEDSTPVSHGAEALVLALIGSGWSDLLSDLPGGLRPNLPQPEQLAAMLKSFVRGPEVRMPMVFLRQFRDPRESTNADVQELVEATAVASPHGVPSILRPSRVLLHHADSHPIGEELGLANEVWIPAQLSMELNMDFVFHDAVR